MSAKIKQPQAITETSLPFFVGTMHSVFHFSDGVLNTQTGCASSDFSTEHPPPQTTTPNSSATQLSRSLAHLGRLAARSGINFGRCFASHFIIPEVTVASGTSGAHPSRRWSRVSAQLRLIVRQMCRRSLLVGASGLPDLGSCRHDRVL